MKALLRFFRQLFCNHANAVTEVDGEFHCHKCGASWAATGPDQ